jgi:hypothetical protein
MTVHSVYAGTLPDRPEERKALLDLCEELEKLTDDWFIPMIRFSLPSGKQPDLVVFKKDCVIVIDFKQSENALVYGQQNGKWVLKDTNDLFLKTLNEDRENPREQINGYWHELRTFFRQHAIEFFSPENAFQFTSGKRPPIRSALVFTHHLHPDSRVFSDYHCRVIGLDKAADFLWVQRDLNLHLTPGEVKKVAGYLNLEEYPDILTLIRKLPSPRGIDFNPYRTIIVADRPQYWLAPRQVSFISSQEPEIPLQASLGDAVKKNNHLLLLGRAGMGKSEEIHRLRAMMAADKEQPVPILIKGYLYEPEENSLPVMAAGTLSAYGINIDQFQVDDLLRDGRLALLVDGLNEVPEKYRGDWNRELGRYLALYTHTTIVMTGHCRTDLSYTDGHLGIAELTPLSDNDLKLLLSKRETSAAILEKIPIGIRDLLHIPLYADMVCTIMEEGNPVDVNTAGALVREFITCIQNREQSKPAMAISSLLLTESDRFLASLAATMYEQMVFTLTITEVTGCFRKTWGQLKEWGYISLPEDIVISSLLKHPLLVEAGNSRIRFSHQVFQDYYAGLWLRDKLAENISQYSHYLAQPIWTEPSLQALTTLPVTPEIVNALFNSRNSELFGRCLVGECGSEIKAACYQEIESILASENKDDETRAFAVNCLTYNKAGAREIALLLGVLSAEEDRLIRKYPDLTPDRLDYYYHDPPTETWRAIRFAYPDKKRIGENALPALLDTSNRLPAARALALQWIHPSMFRKYPDRILGLIEDQIKSPSITVRAAAMRLLAQLLPLTLYRENPGIVRMLEKAQHSKDCTQYKPFARLRGQGILDSTGWFTSCAQEVLRAARDGLDINDLNLQDTPQKLERIYTSELAQRSLINLVEGSNNSNRILTLVRRTVITEHLGSVKGKYAVPYLIRDVVSPSPEGLDPETGKYYLECRIAALGALITIGGTDVVDSLVKAVVNNGTDWTARVLCLVGLDMIRYYHQPVSMDIDVCREFSSLRGVSGTEAILTMLADVKWVFYLRGEFIDWIPYCLGRDIPVNELKKAAVLLFKGSGGQQEFALSLFKELGTHRDLPVLRTMLEDEQVSSRICDIIYRIQILSGVTRRE